MKLYLEDKRTDGVTEQTVQTYRTELRAFTAWCSEEGIESVGEINGLDTKRYKAAQAADYARATVGNRLRTAKELLDWCVSVNAADAGVVRQIEVKRENDVRTGMVTADQAEAVLTHLDRFHYASRRHVTFLLLWTVGCRLGAIHALDVEDVGRHFEDTVGPALRLRHRPETDTPLKNGDGGERFVATTDEVPSIVEDFVNVNRPAVTDKHGWEPLLATKQGRAALATQEHAIRRPTALLVR